MKKSITKLVLVSTLLLSSPIAIMTQTCQSIQAASTKVNYSSAAKLEKAINAGKSVKGKTVRFKITKVEPNSAFGFNMETGKHLNFVSAAHRNVKKDQLFL